MIYYSEALEAPIKKNPARWGLTTWEPSPDGTNLEYLQVQNVPVYKELFTGTVPVNKE